MLQGLQGHLQGLQGLLGHCQGWGSPSLERVLGLGIHEEHQELFHGLQEGASPVLSLSQGFAVLAPVSCSKAAPAKLELPGGV